MPERFISLTDPLVSVHQPALLLGMALERGVRSIELLAGTGLRMEQFLRPETRLSYAQISVLAGRAMQLTGDFGLGLAFGQRNRLSHLAELGPALGSAPTLESALQTMVRFQTILGAAFDMRLADQGHYVGLIAAKAIPLGSNYHFNQEAWLSATFTLVAHLLERPVPELLAEFDYPAPAHRQAYVAVFGKSVRFDRPFCQTLFPKSLLATSLPGACPTMHRVETVRCERVLARHPLPKSLPERIRQMIRAKLDARLPIEAVASALNLSVRTLNRRLIELDTSYRQLQQEERSAAAMALLRETNLSIHVIALRLGFDDPTNFSKAFRTWSGSSPLQFREGRGA